MTRSENDDSIQTIQLIHEHSLEIRHASQENILRIVSPNGSASVSISISERGITLKVDGADLALHTSGALAIDAERLFLHGRQGLAVSSGRDASLRVAGDFEAEARIHNIRASLGNVNVRANDDVCLDGERIRLNSPSLRPLTPKRSEAGQLPPSSGEREG